MFLYQFFGGCNTQGFFFIQKGNPEKVFSFGAGKYGELANGESYNTKKVYKYPTPKISKNIPKIIIGKISKIAKGNDHTLFLMSPAEDVYGVGRSTDGALSIKQEEVLSPILITSKALEGVRIGDIAGGNFLSVLLSTNGVPYSCGNNFSGQCGVGTNENIYSAIPMKMKEKVIQIDCGTRFTVLLTSKRDIYKTGQIFKEGKVNIPTKLKLNEKVKLFRAGGYHLLVVGRTEQLYGMGSNEFYQLTSIISNQSILVLTKITCFNNCKIKDLKCSKYDSYALLEISDMLFGWGRNDRGQSKATGISSNCSIPFYIKSNVEQIEVGARSCFVFCKKGVYVCGDNSDGQLGLGFEEYSSRITGGLYHSNYSVELKLNKELKNIIKRIVINRIVVSVPKFDPKKQLFDVVIKTDVNELF